MSAKLEWLDELDELERLETLADSLDTIATEELAAVELMAITELASATELTSATELIAAIELTTAAELGTTTGAELGAVLELMAELTPILADEAGAIDETDPADDTCEPIAVSAGATIVRVIASLLGALRVILLYTS